MWMNLFNQADIEEVSKKILQRGEIIVLSGAGISTDSGIPDFRSPDGIWSKYDFEEYATIDALLANPEKVFKFFREFLKPLKRATPNAAHKALATLEEIGIVKAVITQNIDNLHQKAGSKRVIELHGNASNSRCMKCRKIYSTEEVDSEVYGFPPICPVCNGLIKPDVILFGEMLPEEALKEAYELSSKTSLMLIIGTSGVVAPASNLPYIAKKSGADIVEINLEPTLFTKSITDYFLQGRASETMERLKNAILSHRGVRGK